MTAEFLFLDSEGNRLGLEPGEDWGDAVLLVAPVTDALKSVTEGIVTGSIDRDGVLAVEGIGLSSAVVEGLSAVPKTFEETYRVVLRLGFTWETRPMPFSRIPSDP